MGGCQGVAGRCAATQGEVLARVMRWLCDGSTKRFNATISTIGPAMMVIGRSRRCKTTTNHSRLEPSDAALAGRPTVGRAARLQSARCCGRPRARSLLNLCSPHAEVRFGNMESHKQREMIPLEQPPLGLTAPRRLLLRCSVKQGISL
jgi:hypothetical protein